jgi:hypothetical protein
MTFVNEYIPEADYEKYGLREIDERMLPSGLPAPRLSSDSWTIDRERDIYLRRCSRGRFPEDSHLSGWTFFWRGELLWFARTVLDTGGERNGPRWGHSRIFHLRIPEHLKPHRDEILKDIREAFEAYAGGGVFSTATDYTEQIDFELE